MLKYIHTRAVTDGSLWQFLPPPVVSSPHVAPIRMIDETGCRGDGYSFRERKTEEENEWREVESSMPCT